MLFSNVIKKLLSYVSNKPIEKGLGVSFDDTVTLSKDSTLTVIEQNSATYGVFFRLRKVEGLFELVGPIRSGDNCLYQIRHKYSGQTLNITKPMLDFLFEKHDL